MKRGAFLCCTVCLLVLVGLASFAGDRLPHQAIVITNDYEFTVENGVCSGQGTLDDPYVIADWVIDAGLDDYGIRIHGTTRAFRIENVEISGAAKSAVYLSYVTNAEVKDCLFVGNWTGLTFNFASYNQIKNCTFESNTDGIHFYFSSENQLMNCVFESNDTAIWFDASNQNEVTGNLVEDAYMAIYLNLGSEENLIVGNAFVDNLHHAHTDDPNYWDDGQEGNYWSGFESVDADEDGIWDCPFEITSDGDQDNFPRVTHPLVPAPPPATCDI
jgi:parallel beta-helix repeat protein